MPENVPSVPNNYIICAAVVCIANASIPITFHNINMNVLPLEEVFLLSKERQSHIWLKHDRQDSYQASRK